VTCFAQSQFLFTTGTIITNVTSEVFRVDMIDAHNTDTVPRTVTVHLVENGGTADTSNRRMVEAVQPNDTQVLREIIGHDLNPGDFFYLAASVDSVLSIRISGRYV
jgi:hypothetical protein